MTGGAREQLSLQPIGRIRSALRTREEAPMQGSEGAPDAWLGVDPAFARVLSRIAAGRVRHPLSGQAEPAGAPPRAVREISGKVAAGTGSTEPAGKMP
jgi:hypothetical protein